ncbi:MAG: methyltransferase domain-containing protein [Bacteroidota bacterium]|nr:methyltransferase domain-containing protein [Bacteroidota bacterium]
MIFSRSVQKEIMDDVLINDERMDDALRELTVINKWLGGNATSRKGVKTMARKLAPREMISILDVGAGGSDVARALESLRRDVKITSLDLNLRACEYSCKIVPTVDVVNGTVHALPFKEGSFDVVHVSLFLHHFTDDELKDILPSLLRIARVGIVINDLRRTVISYIGIILLTRLFSKSAMVRNDGPLSVRRGFTRSELVRVCSMLPSSSFTIQRTWAFRWLVCITKNNE